MRIGQGYDVHRFGDGDHIVIGGVSIPHDRGLVAHSDGDVLIHALCDALLGAAALGDIGRHFPDADDHYCNADSRILLRQAYALLQESGYRISNVDMTIVAQSPVMVPYVDAMCLHIAADLEIDTGQVSIKATTTERLGFEGREEGIAAYAVALIEG